MPKLKKMNIIQKTISLEPFTSRLPSVWPAYKDNQLYFFHNEALKDRQYEYPCNYGMFPINITYSSKTDEEKIVYSLYFDESSGCTESATTISFERISQWYHFFKEYFNLLNNGGHCNRVYSSATEYYEFESNSRYADSLVYGNDKETYEEMDRLYKERGGKEFFDFICTYIIPTYKLPKEYTNYWKCNMLYYPDVIKWIAWFVERSNYDDGKNDAEYQSATINDIEHWNCKASGVTDCCDCEEYFKRGGARTLSSMIEWYDDVQKNIRNIPSIFKKDGKMISCYTPYMFDQIELSNSLENIGQYSILSPQYELGIDYRTANYGDNENTHSGTTVILSGDSKILTANTRGFCFSPLYMENIYDENAWDDYTNTYIFDNPQEFSADTNSLYYAFDDYNKKYVGSTSGYVINAMSSGYTSTIMPTDSILIGGILVPIQTSESGECNNKTYFVEREEHTNTPYTMFNGKKVYGEWYAPNNCYYFSIFKTKNTTNSKCNNETNKLFNINDYLQYNRIKSEENLITYIFYNGSTYIVGDSGVTIDGDDYIRVNGYSYDDENNIYYVSSTTIFDDNLYEVPNSIATISDDGEKLLFNVYNNDIIIYNAKELTGRTSSKLTSLALTDTLVDDIGNKINGIYNIPNTPKYRRFNHQPPAEAELEPLYQVGNVSLIGKFKLTKEKLSDFEDGETANYFIGNIITNMIFYYKDTNGNIVENTRKNWNEYESSLLTISAATNIKEEIEEEETNTIIFDDSIYCDIKYYIGATLKRESGYAEYTLAYDDGKHYNYGVEYTETVKFVKTPTEYNLRKKNYETAIPINRNNPSLHTISYLIYTYELEQDLKDIVSNEYDTIYKIALADFKTEINLINNDLISNFSNYKDMEKYNGIKTSPVFKEEYKMGISSMEKVDANIYIDRGINAAFEKHLKLSEVVSLEALENYGNNYFKIMNN